MCDPHGVPRLTGLQWRLPGMVIPERAPPSQLPRSLNLQEPAGAMHQTSHSEEELSDPQYSWPSTAGFKAGGLEATVTSRLARHHCTSTSTRVPQRHLPISLGRRQRSWGASNAQQKPSNSIWPRGERGRDYLSPTTSTSKQASTSTAYKHHLGGHLEGVKQSKLKQPTCTSPLLIHARAKVFMPPERAAALLRGLSETPGRLAIRQVTDKAAMLESYLQDAHNLSREASRCATIGASQHNIQDTPSASTSEAISPVHHSPALDCTAALPLQKYPARSVRAGFSGPRWASGRAVLHDGDAAASEWGGTPSIASSMKSRATAMYTSKIGYAEMHSKRIAERQKNGIHAPHYACPVRQHQNRCQDTQIGGALEGWGDQKLLSHGAQKRSHHAKQESNG